MPRRSPARAIIRLGSSSFHPFVTHPPTGGRPNAQQSPAALAVRCGRAHRRALAASVGSAIPHRRSRHQADVAGGHDRPIAGGCAGPGAHGFDRASSSRVARARRCGRVVARALSALGSHRPERTLRYLEELAPRLHPSRPHLPARAHAGGHHARVESGTDRPVEGDVVLAPDVADSTAFRAWLPQAKGKFVLFSYAEPTCRPDENWDRLARPESITRMRAARDSTRRAWNTRVQRLGRSSMRDFDAAGVAGVLTSLWSFGWGVNKIFNAHTARVPVLDVSCEDYGLLSRLAGASKGRGSGSTPAGGPRRAPGVQRRRRDQGDREA